MNRALRAALLSGAIAVASPVAAATTVALTGATTTSGNSLLYSSGPVKFSATALTYTNSLLPSVSRAVKYSEGLGVNPSGDNRHTIDNSGALDFILLRFETAVALNGASFANMNWYGDSSPDTDATITYAASNYAAIGQTYATSLTNTNSARINFFNATATPFYANGFESGSTALVNGYSNRSFNVSATPNVSTAWLIGASVSNLDRKVDSFKLKSITYDLPGADAGAVPEPTTWALLIFGFGAIGGTMRRKVRVHLAYA